jgi:hypothetical protein
LSVSKAAGQEHSDCHRLAECIKQWIMPVVYTQLDQLLHIQFYHKSLEILPQPLQTRDSSSRQLGVLAKSLVPTISACFMQITSDYGQITAVSWQSSDTQHRSRNPPQLDSCVMRSRYHVTADRFGLRDPAFYHVPPREIGSNPAKS